MLLELRNIHKSFGAVHVLKGVDFDVDAGEVVALCGDNGAGKSTLIKAIAGVHQPDDGSIRLDGREVSFHSPEAAVEAGIATVYQDLALCDNLDIVQNMFLGRERYSRLLGLPLGRATRVLDRKSMTLTAAELLADLRVTTVTDVRAKVASLSGGQRQSIAIARAVMGDSRIIILDEPTAALGVAQTYQVGELVKRLRDQGLGVILISHDMNQVFELADRVTVLRQGRRDYNSTTSSSTPTEVVSAITGAHILEESA
jgi:D-xylose transport system ATP-binding protein